MFKNKIENKPKYPINWYADKYQSAMVWRNWLLIAVLISLIGVLAMTLAAISFVPLKSVKPFVIQVDEKTGSSEIITGKSVKEISANEALFKYFAMNYIRARENYSVIPEFLENKSLLAYNIDLVRVNSSENIFASYKNAISPSNPNSPINIFKDKTVRKVFFKTFIIRTNLDDNGLASVQANVDVVEQTVGQFPIQYSLIIDLSAGFDSAYANSSLTEKERQLNPLGFRVISYNVEEITR